MNIDVIVLLSTVDLRFQLFNNLRMKHDSWHQNAQKWEMCVFFIFNLKIYTLLTALLICY